MRKAFKIEAENVLITGQPRNDFLFTNNFTLKNLLGISDDNKDKMILWMPTYRKSIKGDIRKQITTSCCSWNGNIFERQGDLITAGVSQC